MFDFRPVARCAGFLCDAERSPDFDKMERRLAKQQKKKERREQKEAKRRERDRLAAESWRYESGGQQSQSWEGHDSSSGQASQSWQGYNNNSGSQQQQSSWQSSSDRYGYSHGSAHHHHSSGHEQGGGRSSWGGQASGKYPAESWRAGGSSGQGGNDAYQMSSSGEGRGQQQYQSSSGEGYHSSEYRSSYYSAQSSLSYEQSVQYDRSSGTEHWSSSGPSAEQSTARYDEESIDKTGEQGWYGYRSRHYDGGDGNGGDDGDREWRQEGDKNDRWAYHHRRSYDDEIQEEDSSSLSSSSSSNCESDESDVDPIKRLHPKIWWSSADPSGEIHEVETFPEGAHRICSKYHYDSSMDVTNADFQNHARFFAENNIPTTPFAKAVLYKDLLQPDLGWDDIGVYVGCVTTGQPRKCEVTSQREAKWSGGHTVMRYICIHPEPANNHRGNSPLLVFFHGGDGTWRSEWENLHRKGYSEADAAVEMVKTFDYALACMVDYYGFTVVIPICPGQSQADLNAALDHEGVDTSSYYDDFDDVWSGMKLKKKFHKEIFRVVSIVFSSKSRQIFNFSSLDV